MELLNIDVGLKSYQLVEGGEPLVFNPGDPSVYARYMDAVPTLKEMEVEYSNKANTTVSENATDEEKVAAGQKSFELLREADTRFKGIFNSIFACGNDFDKILRGVNVMAVTADGDRVINKLLEALSPIMQDGVTACVTSEVRAAKLNREQRRALGK